MSTFPSEYFRYVLILSSLVVIGWLLARLLAIVARPNRDARLKQYREAYESFFCPICQFPDPPRTAAVHGLDAAEPAAGIASRRPRTSDEPYTCPSCATPLYEKCPNCGAIRHALLPACEHCGTAKEV